MPLFYLLFGQELNHAIHELRDNVKNFIVTFAAACGAAGLTLDIGKSVLYILNTLRVMQNLLNIRQRDLFTVTDDLVFSGHF